MKNIQTEHEKINLHGATNKIIIIIKNNRSEYEMCRCAIISD